MAEESEERKLPETDNNSKASTATDLFAAADIFKTENKIFSQLTQTVNNSELAKTFSRAAVDLSSGVIDFFSTPDAAKEGKAGGKNESSSDRIGRKDLEEVVNNTIKDDTQRSAFLKNVESFETRANKDKLPQDEKEKFYAQVRDVLEASKTGNKNFDSKYLQTVASDMIKEAARPGSVNQGGYGTCTAAALQSALFRAEPATIGGMVRDLALTGEYKTVDGSLIKPSEKNLKPDKYHKDETPYSRNSVDQLAQIGLLNTFWQRQAGLEGDNKKLVGSIKYEEGHPQDYMGDDRTRLMDYSKGAPQPITKEVAVGDPVSKMDESQLGGSTEFRPVSGPRILDMANINDMYNQLRGNKGNLKVISGGGSDPVFKPKSEEELKEFIEKARKDNNGTLPAMVLGVHTNVEPFKSDLKDAFYSKEKTGKDPADIHGHHAVALFDFDSKTNKTIIENQWGDNVDHTGEKGSKDPVDLKDVFKAIKGEAEPEKEKKDKPAPEKIDREKNANAYIDEYKKFVQELEADTDADPSKVLHHQIRLNESFKTWDRTDESKEQLGKIADQLTKMLPAMSLKDASSTYASLAKEFKANGMEEQTKAISIALDQKVKSTMKDLGDKKTGFWQQREIIDSVDDALKAFKAAGDEKAIERTTQTLLSTADAVRKENGVENQRSIETTRAVLRTLNESGKKKETDTLINNTLAAIKEAETAAKGDKTVAARAKIALASDTRDMEKSEISNKLYAELEDTYKEMKTNGVPGGSKSLRSDVLQSLLFHNRDEKNADKLEPLVHDWVADIKEMIEKDKGKDEHKNDWRANMLERAGEMLDAAKRPEQALKYYKEALDSARKLEEDQHKGQKIAQKAIDCCTKLGKKEEAAALAKEFKLEKWLR